MKNKKIWLVSLIAVGLVFCGLKTDAYQIDRTYQLGSYEGSSQATTNKYITLHEIGMDNSPAVNNAIYMKREWSNNGAYTAFIVGDGGKVYQVGQDGYVQWGAGSYMNANSPVQIELARTWDRATFNKDYKAYIDLTRDMASKYNIPLTLDTAYANNGVKTHLWVTNNIWGDHTDPYGYLARWGVTKEKLARDIKYGVNATAPSHPQVNKPTPNKNVKKGDKVEVVKALDYNNNKFGKYFAKYDVIDVKGDRAVIGQGNVVTTAIHTGNLKVVKKDEQFHNQAKRYYTVKADYVGIYKSPNLTEANAYKGTYAKGSIIWVSKTEKSGAGRVRGLTPAGWINLSTDVMSK